MPDEDREFAECPECDGTQVVSEDCREGYERLSTTDDCLDCVGGLVCRCPECGGREVTCMSVKEPAWYATRSKGMEWYCFDCDHEWEDDELVPV